MDKLTSNIERIRPDLLRWCQSNVRFGNNEYKFGGDVTSSSNGQRERHIYIRCCDKFHLNNLHFEYYQGHVELHFEYEGAPQDLAVFNCYLFEKVQNSIDFVWLSWQGKQNGRCQLRTPITSCQILKWAFEKMYNTFNPLIESFQERGLAQSIMDKEVSINISPFDDCLTIWKADCLTIWKAEKVLSNNNITIPPYQRPYRWQYRKHIHKLLNDIIEHIPSGKEYRIGTIILHLNNNKLDIVDGQQRLVSLSIILKVLGIEIEQSWIKNVEFKHIDSRNNILYNFLHCKDFFDKYSVEEKERISEYILQSCSFNIIIVHDLSDAFQLFDSQNSKGKALGPEDLLKAFHLREMGEDQEYEKRAIVKEWEKAIEDRLLNHILGNYLFRIRCWNRNEWKYYFTKDQVDEFKGVTFNKNDENFLKYPYQERLWFMAQSHLVQVNSEIINGKPFFEYVFHYLNLYKEMRALYSDPKQLWGSDYNGENGVVQNGSVIYPGYWRTGDSRLLNLYKISLFTFIDRFGMCPEFYDYSRLSFCWIFKHRLLQGSVFYQTILKIVQKWNPCYEPLNCTKPQIQSLENKYHKLPEEGYEKPNNELESIINKLNRNK